MEKPFPGVLPGAVRSPVPQESVLSTPFFPRLKLLVASSLPATIGGNFLPVRPLPGGDGCQGAAGQRKTFLGHWFKPSHLQGDAGRVVSLSASLGLSSRLLLSRCVRAKGGRMKEEVLRPGSSEGVWVLLPPSPLPVHGVLGRKLSLPLTLRSHGPAASWLVLLAEP